MEPRMPLLCLCCQACLISTPCTPCSSYALLYSSSDRQGAFTCLPLLLESSSPWLAPGLSPGICLKHLFHGLLEDHADPPVRASYCTQYFLCGSHHACNYFLVSASPVNPMRAGTTSLLEVWHMLVVYYICLLTEWPEGASVYKWWGAKSKL